MNGVIGEWCDLRVRPGLGFGSLGRKSSVPTSFARTEMEIYSFRFRLIHQMGGVFFSMVSGRGVSTLFFFFLLFSTKLVSPTAYLFGAKAGRLTGVELSFFSTAGLAESFSETFESGRVGTGWHSTSYNIRQISFPFLHWIYSAVLVFLYFVSFVWYRLGWFGSLILLLCFFFFFVFM